MRLAKDVLLLITGAVAASALHLWLGALLAAVVVAAAAVLGAGAICLLDRWEARR